MVLLTPEITRPRATELAPQFTVPSGAATMELSLFRCRGPHPDRPGTRCGRPLSEVDVSRPTASRVVCKRCDGATVIHVTEPAAWGC